MSVWEAVLAAVIAGIVLTGIGWLFGVPRRINQWRVGRRVYLPVSVTPEYLCGLRKGRTVLTRPHDVQPYKGKWIRFAGKLDDLDPQDGKYRVILHDHSGSEPRKPSVFMYFSRRKWGRRLELMPPGSDINAHCQVWAFDPDWINLGNCELVEG